MILGLLATPGKLRLSWRWQQVETDQEFRITAAGTGFTIYHPPSGCQAP